MQGVYIQYIMCDCVQVGGGGGDVGTSRDMAELERKANDYDQLLERVSELQQVRVRLDHELAPLRAERASILSENAALREGSNPDKYIKLKTSYTKLSEQCIQLQRSLTLESNECELLRRSLEEERAMNERIDGANQLLQRQLEAATDEKGLQAIRERMERYKSEREQLKTALSQTQAEIEAHGEREVELQQTVVQLQVRLYTRSKYVAKM